MDRQTDEADKQAQTTGQRMENRKRKTRCTHKHTLNNKKRQITTG